MISRQSISFFFIKKMILYRKKSGISQLKLSEIVNCHLNTINSIETGKQVPSIETAIKIAFALNISMDELIKEYNERFNLLDIE